MAYRNAKGHDLCRLSEIAPFLYMAKAFRRKASCKCGSSVCRKYRRPVQRFKTARAQPIFFPESSHAFMLLCNDVVSGSSADTVR